MWIGRQSLESLKLFRFFVLHLVIAVLSLLCVGQAIAGMLLSDDFEDPAKSQALWDTSNSSVLRVIKDPAKAHSGSGVLELQYQAGTTGPGYFGANFTPVPEVYVRWYEKYSANWIWSGNGQKLIKIQTGSNANLMFFTQWGGSDPRVHPEQSLIDVVLTQNIGSTVSFERDRWYCIEVYAKQDTGRGDGVVRIWISDELKLDSSGLQLSTQFIPYDFLLVSAYYNEGGSTPSGVPSYQVRWLDDMAASTTRIGCDPVTGDKTPPSAPQGLRLMSQ